ncbi:MAG: response regulator transcription factor [Mobilitalea sp.]
MRVLIVEDEFSLADTISDRLKEEGYAVDIAYDGNEGFLQAVTGIYDVIILDVMLPKMDGFTALTKIREAEIHTPVLMFTAKSEIDNKVHGFDCGADDYLTKPFEMKELLARVRALSRRRGEIDLSVLTYGDLQVNVNSCEINCLTTKQSMKLGAKEYLTLEYLMHNQKQIVSKEQIAEKIWGFDNEAEYNKVEVYISFVRKKIKFIGSNVRIKVIRGVGYCLEATE